MPATIHIGHWETSSPALTLDWGAALGRVMPGGLTVALVGPLGAGKTQLVKGIAAGNGVGDPREVTSPTFTLIHEYHGRVKLYHIDAYRLRGPPELTALGFEEMVDPQTVVVVEWADRVRGVLPTDALWIEIDAVGETARRITVQAGGPLASRCLAALREAPV